MSLEQERGVRTTFSDVSPEKKKKRKNERLIASSAAEDSMGVGQQK